jgi:glycosyltransferase involved in cell wall biosynthesis
LIGLTICSFNRPEYAERCVKSVRKHLTDVVDHIVFVNDGSDAKHNGSYRRVEKATQSMGGTYIALDENGGVAKAKNVGLRYLLSKSCDILFTLEDDLIIQSPKAITEYVRIAEDTGLSHFMFAHHGPANISGPVETIGDVQYFFHSVGAWCMFTADDLTKYGLLDENLHNAWEHVLHELEIGVEPHRYPDIIGSTDYIAEIPGSIERSSIRVRDDWWSSIADGLIYWRDNKPDSFKALFGDGMPLQQYAIGVIGDN